MAITDRRKRERERRRAEILAAAAAIFAERGVDGASMDAIAERAELGKATLYYYFDTKEQLHAAVIADATERFFAELAGVDRRFGTLADLVEELLVAYARFIQRSPTLLQVLTPYLPHLHFTGRAEPRSTGMPRHLAFVSEYERLLAASPWAAEPERFTRHLTGVFVSLGQLQLGGQAAELEPQLRFHVDLIRHYRAGQEGNAP